MANIKASKKDALTSEKRRKKNSSRRSMIRTFVKKVRVAIMSGNKTTAEDAFKKMQPIIDSHVNKGLIHKNKAARYKSNLSLQIKKISKI
ncbi:30S ribosomal protein S20 [Buchnera aphidicola str. APS (Acyrthosiphon pisum)]|uniref:Small ribosomal subunit protein bS20 n=3 Tax=Buchnera aphidicola TaxID=9 RepID=RS20_BUCAI|nr:30S ribosomal protein S20 [Buchnera aphidicola]B8D756.1 RecName: Full=Small ribosomal subunit protein bS20; AltName: Full=30S ribosomal protein S20 [Buchnera aphidicola str. Tuc7 (Acyrthosiphon pisum)]B8D8V2.1 RecName: Full=Small ribosomal subunit protein bS20; AltName: Full=30S ribosomal protein S20 [Buchnera aphidicola str. 5A (Acyrthosiphon pisum)]P57251.1 RecName: Full=Small ribosomal subunit protein bS20; AltName: Full=30S ribosomal protein S20 [Buchnera aphidicola str. APS (Acyrthosipho